MTDVTIKEIALGLLQMKTASEGDPVNPLNRKRSQP